MKRFHLIKIVLVVFSISSLLFVSCNGKDDKVITGEALFSYVSDGYTITFTNTSTVSGEVTYLWNFGDESTSTEESPVHSYEAKGAYTVTLTVTDENSDEHPISTTINVNKATRIDLTDNSFDDWDAVSEDEYIMSTGGDSAGIVTSAKVDFDADYVYVYIEFNGTLDYGYYFDIYFDMDNDSTTGYKTWIWNKIGLDYLVEGQLTISDAIDAVGTFAFSGEAQDAWSWGETEFSTDWLTIGNSADFTNTAAIEFGFSRSKVTDLDGDIIKFGITLSDPTTWSSDGYAPNVNSNGTTVNMQ